MCFNIAIYWSDIKCISVVFHIYILQFGIHIQGYEAWERLNRKSRKDEGECVARSWLWFAWIHFSSYSDYFLILRIFSYIQIISKFWIDFDYIYFSKWVLKRIWFLWWPVVAIIGLAKPYIDSETKKHIAYAERRSIIGNFKQYEFEFGSLYD